MIVRVVAALLHVLPDPVKSRGFSTKCLTIFEMTTPAAADLPLAEI